MAKKILRIPDPWEYGIKLGGKWWVPLIREVEIATMAPRLRLRRTP